MAALSYLDVLALTGDCFRGGLLTVNELGLPTEFIHSDPIRPSKLQLSLYGTTLGRYLMVDVVGKGLLDASQARGAPVVVGHSELLALATKIKRPLCKLTRTNQRPLGEVGEVREGSAEEFAAQLNEVQNPYIFRIYDRINFGVDQHLPTFIECASRFDLLEPLERVKRTLEVLRQDEE
jgi:hypothetical protein